MVKLPAVDKASWEAWAQSCQEPGPVDAALREAFSPLGLGVVVVLGVHRGFAGIDCGTAFPLAAIKAARGTSEKAGGWPTIVGDEGGDEELPEWAMRACSATAAALEEAGLLVDGKRVVVSLGGAPAEAAAPGGEEKEFSVWTALGPQADPRDGLYVAGEGGRWTQVLIPPGGLAIVCGAK